MSRLVVVPGDPLYKYYQKGEIKTRYWNPQGLFDEVHIISLCKKDVEPSSVQALVGNAKLYIHEIGRPNMATLPFYYPRVRSLVSRIEPDIIRAHGPWQCGSLGVYAGRCLGIPCVASIHNDIDVVRRYERPVLLNLVRPLERYTMSKASAVICVSNYLHRYAKRHGSERTITNYNRVYTSQFVHERKYSENRPLTILSVMRLDPQKDPETIIRAIKPLDANLVLVGQGELEDKLHRLVEELDMGARVSFVPSVPNDRIHETYRAADVFAMSTLYEGFCIPVLEAMASGLPVVACPTEPIPELLGDTGLIVDRSADAFRDGFARLMDDVNLRRSLGIAARTRAHAFDGDRMEQREARIYSAFMSGDQSQIGDLFDPAFRLIQA